MAIIINDCDGLFTKTLYNWNDRMIPQVGDILIIRLGIVHQVKVIARIFDEKRPDMVYLTTDYKHE